MTTKFEIGLCASCGKARHACKCDDDRASSESHSPPDTPAREPSPPAGVFLSTDLLQVLQHMLGALHSIDDRLRFMSTLLEAMSTLLEEAFPEVDDDADSVAPETEGGPL